MTEKIKLTTFEEYKRRALGDLRVRQALAQPDDDPFLEVAYRLISLRKDRGWTQAELARKMRVSQQAVGRLESLNYRGHSLQSLHRVAEACGCHLRISFEPRALRRATRAAR